MTVEMSWFSALCDDDYEFLGTFGDKRLLIGNAVPPLLARAIGESLLPHLLP